MVTGLSGYSARETETANKKASRTTPVEMLNKNVLLLLFMFSPSQTTFYITPETTKQLH